MEGNFGIRLPISLSLCSHICIYYIYISGEEIVNNFCGGFLRPKTVSRMNQYWITSLILVECLKMLRVELMITKNRRDS